MIKVLLKKTSSFPVSAIKIKKTLARYLEKKGISSNCHVSVAIVGKKQMLALAKKFLNEENTLHNVLSFTENEVSEKFVYPNENVIYLGEIVVCYPKAFQEAKNENKRIEKKVIELVKHGANHLMGVHHD